MRVTIDTSTGLMHEAVGDSEPDYALIETAVAGGILPANVEIRTVTQAELDVLIAARIPLSQHVASAIVKTYSDVDALYAVAVGNRAEEYRQAETAALAYQAAGYAGAVSEYISSWATTNPPMTNAQSADAIIARAAALRSAMVSVRTQRFVSQAAMRAATTHAELDMAIATWNTFVAATKAALA